MVNCKKFFLTVEFSGAKWLRVVDFSDGVGIDCDYAMSFAKSKKRWENFGRSACNAQICKSIYTEAKRVPQRSQRRFDFKNNKVFCLL